jgi:purine-cytosine permease-like protein
MAASGWRRGDVPGWALALGIVVVIAVSLGLASLGAVGIAAVAVLLLAVIGLFRLFVAVDVPAAQATARPTEQTTDQADQPG